MTVGAARAALAAAALVAIGAAFASGTDLGEARGPVIAGAFGLLALLADLHRRGRPPDGP